MAKPVIAVDFDDVVFETGPNFITHYNSRYGTSAELKDLYSNKAETWGISGPEFTDRVNDFLDSDDGRSIRPCDGAVSAINQLIERYELHIVTGRDDSLADATESMVQALFPGVFSSIEYTHLLSGGSRSKVDVCHDINAKYMIDDHLRHADIVAESGVSVLLFGHYPWNRSDNLHPRIRRVAGWDEIVQLLM